MELWRVEICIRGDKHRTRYSRRYRSILRWTQVLTFDSKWGSWQKWPYLYNWSDHFCSRSCHCLQTVYLFTFLISLSKTWHTIIVYLKTKTKQVEGLRIVFTLPCNFFDSCFVSCWLTMYSEICNEYIDSRIKNWFAKEEINF